MVGSAMVASSVTNGLAKGTAFCRLTRNIRSPSFHATQSAVSLSSRPVNWPLRPVFGLSRGSFSPVWAFRHVLLNRLCDKEAGPGVLRKRSGVASCQSAGSAEAAVVPSNATSKKKQEKGQKGGSSQGKNDKISSESSKIAPREEDFSRWYLDVIREAELAENGPVRGTIVIRPYAYAIWEAIQSWLNARFKETGHSNMYFPQFIPMSFLEKEAEHVEGFKPELAIVTVGGGKELEEPLVVRPTSETIVNYMFAQWIQSYRDLPLLVNQWANVTRWEMRTRPFVRTLEFLWQEGHTAHATAEEAEEEALRMIDIYRRFAEEEAAMAVVTGRKSRTETFAGAVRTYTIEAMMGDRKALQAGTSHNLGQNFAKAFNIQFLDEAGERPYVWQTSWGMSTRMVGGVIMTHGDDTGLMLPPRLAPIQVVIVPIWKKEEEKTAVLAAAQEVEVTLSTAGVRVKVDASEQRTPGFKYNFWEMKGVPLRIEIGPRDVATSSVVTARRDRPGKGGKTFGVSKEAGPLCQHVQEQLHSIQVSMFEKAKEFRESHTVDVASYEDLKEAIAQGKWARGAWAGSDADEARIKEETGATLRCFPFEQPAGEKTCFMTGAPNAEVAIFSKSY